LRCRRVHKSQRLRDVLDELVAASRGQQQLELLSRKEAVAPNGAVFDSANTKGQRVAQTLGIAQALATVDCREETLKVDTRIGLSSYEPPELVGASIREHLLPAFVASLEELPPAQHRDVLSVIGHTARRAAEGRVARQFAVHGIEQLGVAFTALRECE